MDRATVAVIVAFAAGVTAVLLAAPVLRWGSLPRVTGTHATADGAAVRLTRPHPAFTASLPLVT
jgi:hypothetical protein